MPATIESAAYEIAFVSDFGLIGDASATQAVWDGIRRYAAEKKVAAKHYIPKNQSAGAYIDTYRKAIDDGARLVIVTGILQETPVWHAQAKYKDTSFIIIDGAPHNEDYTDETVSANTAAMRFNSAHAGFLAGYAAVRAGLTHLGFIGAMPTPEIANAGLGFIQGAEYAASELDLPDASVELKYAYAGTFMADPRAQMLASEWYAAVPENLDGENAVPENEDSSVTVDSGEDSSVTVDSGEETSASEILGGEDSAPVGDGIIFAAGGELEYRVVLAAARSRKRVILYDNTASYKSPAVFAAVSKNYGDAVYDCIASYYNGNFPGGEITIYGVAEGGVGLSFPDIAGQSADNDIASLSSNSSDYSEILTKIASGAIDIISSTQRPYAPPPTSAVPTRAVAVSEY